MTSPISSAGTSLTLQTGSSSAVNSSEDIITLSAENIKKYALFMEKGDYLWCKEKIETHNLEIDKSEQTQALVALFVERTSSDLDYREKQLVLEAAKLLCSTDIGKKMINDANCIPESFKIIFGKKGQFDPQTRRVFLQKDEKKFSYISLSKEGVLERVTIKNPLLHTAFCLSHELGHFLTHYRLSELTFSSEEVNAYSSRSVF